jgi:hypothetical protein
MSDFSQEGHGPAALKEPTAWVWGRPWTRRRSARLWLVLSWFAAMLAWRVLRTPNALLLFQVVSVALLAVVSWPWIRGPYRLYTRGWLPVDSRYQPAIATVEALTFPIHVTSALNKLGFVVAGILAKDNQLRGRRVEISVLYSARESGFCASRSHYQPVADAALPCLQNGFCIHPKLGVLEESVKPPVG